MWRTGKLGKGRKMYTYCQYDTRICPAIDNKSKNDGEEVQGLLVLVRVILRWMHKSALTYKEGFRSLIFR